MGKLLKTALPKALFSIISNSITLLFQANTGTIITDRNTLQVEKNITITFSNQGIVMSKTMMQKK